MCVFCRILCALLLLAGLLPLPANQVSGYLKCDANLNSAVDPSDRPVPGVLVVVTNFAGTYSNANWSTLDGFYIIGLPAAPDTYRVFLHASTVPSGTTMLMPQHYDFYAEDSTYREFLLRNPVCVPVTRYVSPNSPNPAPPYDSWASAARNIQQAIDAAAAGDTILVADGVYATGGKVAIGTLTNRVALDKPVTVQSVNGPAATILVGWTTGGPARCAYLVNGAVLSGFTLSGGYAPPISADQRDQEGAGAWCQAQAILTNCVLVSGSAQRAGGAFRGTLHDCHVVSNTAALYGGGVFESTVFDSALRGNAAISGGAAYSATLIGSTLISNTVSGRDSMGGGAAYSSLSNCVIRGNVASSMAGGGGVAYCSVQDSEFSQNAAGTGGGGGAYYSDLLRCRLVDNFASGGGAAAWSDLSNCLAVTNRAILGGATFSGTLVNSTLVGNAASNQGGGTAGTIATNSIILFNTAPTGPNNYGAALAYTLTDPLPAGPGNLIPGTATVFANLPGGDFRLAPGSPAIDTGLNSVVPPGAVDLDGLPRIAGTWVDLGAYEFQSGFRAWLASYGLPSDGSADFADPDNDGAHNWAEWVAGTVPTNPNSKLIFTHVEWTPSGLALTWPALPGRSYTVERASALSPSSAFSIRQDNISVGVSGPYTYVDQTASATGSGFYRLRVRLQ